MTETGFDLGELVITPGTQALIDDGVVSAEGLLRDHQEKHPLGHDSAGWLVTQFLAVGLWVITEADRSRTTIGLLAEVNDEEGRRRPTAGPVAEVDDA